MQSNPSLSFQFLYELQPSCAMLTTLVRAATNEGVLNVRSAGRSHVKGFNRQHPLVLCLVRAVSPI